MLSVIEKVNDVVNNFIWGVPAMICIIGVGLLLSFRTGFIQIRKFPYAMKVTLGRMLKNVRHPTERSHRFRQCVRHLRRRSVQEMWQELREPSR